MKVIVSVLGKDKIGIIAKVCNFLADNQCNILDISQNIVQDYLNMIMIVDIRKEGMTFDNFNDGMAGLAEEIGVTISVQNSAIFESMHRI